jgi:type II secretion system protein L
LTAKKRSLPYHEGFMAKHTLALDIKAHGVDWVLLRGGLRKVTIEKSGQLVCRLEDAEKPGAVEALKDLRATIASPGMTCIAAIESRGLFTRCLNVPFRDRRKVRQILPLELEATLPVTIDALTMDFQMAGNGGAPLVLSTAMAKTQVDGYLQLLHEAGLDPTLLTFSGLPAAMLLAAGPLGEQTALLIDGDSDHSTLFWIGRHRLQFLRSWTPPATGGEPAERLKQAIAQTRETTDQFLGDQAAIGTIFLTPRAARHFAPEALAAALACEVAVFDLTQSSPTSLSGELVGGYGQGALALGLYEPMADKGLNFFRPPFPLKRFVQQHRKSFIRSGVLAAVLVILLLTGVLVDIRRNETRAQSLKSAAEAILKDTFPETRNVVNPLQQMIVKLREARADAVTVPHGAQATKIDILQTVSQSLPPQLDIHVVQLVAGTERVQINGTTGTFEAVNEAKGHLEKSGFFDAITIVSANMDQRAGRVRFRLSADLRNPL